MRFLGSAVTLWSDDTVCGGITGTGEKIKDMLIRKIIIRVIIVAVAFSSKPDVLVGLEFVYLYLNFGFSLTVPAHCRPHRM